MPHPNERTIVRHPEVKGMFVTLDPAVDYASDDVLVESYPWAFEPKRTTRRDSVEIATAEPGQKRTRARS